MALRFFQQILELLVAAAAAGLDDSNTIITKAIRSPIAGIYRPCDIPFVGRGISTPMALRSSGRSVSWCREIAIFLITLLIMLWPLLLNRAPFYSDDSGSYLRGGEFGLNTGLSMIELWWNSLFAAPSVMATTVDPNAAVAHAISEAGGTRSVIYSVVTYLLRAPGISLIALAIAQASAVTLSVALLRRLIDPQSVLWSSLAVGAGVALLTSASWYAAYVVPDIFAGVAIAGAVALTVLVDRARLAVRISLVSLIAFCITVHGSHLPIILATLLAGAAANFWIRRPTIGASLGRMLWSFSPIVLAVVTLLGTSYVAFGELSLAPKRYPIQLARSVADGPGAWHLRDHCATEHYAICEVFGPIPPRQVGEFLWSENGVRNRASSEQMERIRAEEGIIVRRAALEYPVHQLRRSATNTFRQLFEFGPEDLIFGLALVDRKDPSLIEAHPDRPSFKAVGKALIYLSFFASLLLLVVFRKRLTNAELAALSVAGVGLLANAAVCGALSGVTDRYQGRVAWVLPALAFIILLRVWRESRPLATTAKVTLA